MVDVESGGDACSHKALELCPEERRFCVFSLAFSESGHDIVCGANDGNIYIYNLAANDRTLKVCKSLFYYVSNLTCPQHFCCTRSCFILLQ